MAILNSKQVGLASALIKESGFKLKQYNDSSVLKLQKGKTIIYLYPKN